MSERYSVTEKYIRFPISLERPSRDDLLRMNAYVCWNILMEGIAAPLYTPVVKGRRTGEPVYLPASRTGFMLTYPQIVESSLQISFISSSRETSSELTLPYVDFLQLITKFESQTRVNKRDKEIIDVFVKRDFIPRITYQPQNSSREIPLYVTSSVVTEISPLLLLFKSNINFKTLIIEEPEAHLHPALQQKMARLIINLVNAGIPVWLTTHSDVILQHMNNMLGLNKNKDISTLKEKFGYTNKDLLTQDIVSMYQFEELDSGESKLQELKCTPYGFEVPTFNNAIEKMVAEVYAFQEGSCV